MDLVHVPVPVLHSIIGLVLWASLLSSYLADNHDVDNQSFIIPSPSLRCRRWRAHTIPYNTAHWQTAQVPVSSSTSPLVSAGCKNNRASPLWPVPNPNGRGSRLKSEHMTSSPPHLGSRFSNLYQNWGKRHLIPSGSRIAGCGRFRPDGAPKRNVSNSGRRCGAVMFLLQDRSTCFTVSILEGNKSLPHAQLSIQNAIMHYLQQRI